MHNSNLISHLQTENCGRFWFQPTKYLKKIDEVYSELNNANSDLESFVNPSDIKVGQTLAAVYPSDDHRQVEYYRAKVIFIDRKKDSKAPFEVKINNPILFCLTRKIEIDFI